MRKHAVRKAILRTLHADAPRPLDLDELERDTRYIVPAGVSREELVREVEGLVIQGYAINHLAARGHLYGITAKGADQVALDAPPDEYVHGEAAFTGR